METDIQQFENFVNFTRSFLLSKQEQIEEDIASMNENFSSNGELDVAMNTSEFFTYNAFLKMRRDSTKYSNIFVKTNLVYLMSIYEHYLCKVQEIFYSKNPNNLTATPLTEIQKLATITNRLKKFSYKSCKKQLKAIEINLKVDISSLFGDSLEQLEEIVATRNIIVHNHGFIDDKYLEIVPKSSLAIGEKRPLSIDYLEDSIRCVNMVLFNLIDNLREKEGDE